MFSRTSTFLALLTAFAVPAAAARPHFIDVKLVTTSNSPKPGQTILLGLEMIPQRGWHGYWSNPGESGLAPVVRWTLPRGVHVGPLEHPAPTLMSVMGVTSYVHAGPHILLARVKLDQSLPMATVLPVIANVTLATCSDRLCVPEKAQLSLRLLIGNGSPSGQVAMLRSALIHLPQPIKGGTFVARGGKIVLQLPPSAKLQPSRTRFFPDTNGYWDARTARVVSGGRLTLVSAARGAPPEVITGVASDGYSAYRVRLHTRSAH